MRISDWSSDVCFSDLTQLRLDSGATQPNIAFYNGSGDAEDRNWAIVASHDGYGDLCFRRSNAAGGDPLTAGTTIFRILPTGQWQGVSGTSAAPAYSFAADADTIGRAPCRERVWQYVYISVVAVSLTTNTQDNLTKNNSETRD